MRMLVAALCGLLFAVGLGLGGLTDPANVQGFLDVAGDWRPSLAFVMGGALAVHAPLQWLIRRRRERPVLAPAFPNVSRRDIDAPLVVGAALFGMGWGLSGYCPGPALTALGTGSASALVFGAGLLGGMVLFHVSHTFVVTEPTQR
jgi:uncharacterized protein